jgi:hypothetical protein
MNAGARLKEAARRKGGLRDRATWDFAESFREVHALAL